MVEVVVLTLTKSLEHTGQGVVEGDSPNRVGWVMEKENQNSKAPRCGIKMSLGPLKLLTSGLRYTGDWGYRKAILVL